MKTFAAVLFVLCFVLFGFAAAASAEDRHIGVTINEELQEYDQPALLRDGRTLVPMRGIFESIGAGVTWDPKTKTVTSVKDGVLVKLPIGERIAYINGRQITLDQGAQVIKGRTMVPLRLVAESYDVSVTYNAAEFRVELWSDDYYGSPLTIEEKLLHVAEEVSGGLGYYRYYYETLSERNFYHIYVNVPDGGGNERTIAEYIIGREWYYGPLIHLYTRGVDPDFYHMRYIALMGHYG
ncbi:copper amine oxidase N-terminal domain-containing protein [Alkalicoccus urumqiensis]|uniref:Copper amine oxidase-like N-terminal domain-containing protein n=1 Tax=Alkalicoccus urumqiensis TaxID=1548213 RepID=A0A2P6MHP9_ALKUR|nr:copper amine oxidase N-terminal domain-containing protein [Alkalicoccus urumqiensis]PRO65819.1 hypothetical protein C6I21_07935 [Alkalicoccus urumqiensis]